MKNVKSNNMKNLTFSVRFLLMALAVSNCKSPSYTPATLPEKQLIFGSGGGFSGAVTRYILLENGQLFRYDSLPETLVEMGRVRKSKAKAHFKTIDQLALQKRKINEPGNVYYFLEYQYKNYHAKCIWGNSDYEVDKELSNFYQALTNEARQVKGAAK